MRIKSIYISNFKAIKEISLTDLENTVVIAGPNGSGKSCIFDAIRLLKSVYGGYKKNEWHQWFGEFQIQLKNLKKDVKRILNDKSKPLKIVIGFEFTDKEKSFFRENGPRLIESAIWASLLPDDMGIVTSEAVPAAEIRHHQANVEERKKTRVNALFSDLDKELFLGELSVSVNGDISISPCPTLDLCFTSYDPKNIGFIDYHGANRTYNRENVGGINLNIQTSEQNIKDHALYNTNSKYSNIKSEMAGAYVRELLAREADIQLIERKDVIETLKELFVVFFPGKKFQGPKPTPEGGLSFPVLLNDGSTHDINELSSGEKEVLYGYLRIRNTSPQNSVLLLDEPELHLNPRLIRGLPKFYQKHLGVNGNNQIWLVTHSDAFLRETVGEPGFSVFHMKSPLNLTEFSEQIVKINANIDLEAALIDLVGDLAAFSPNSKVLIFEGGGDADFDLKLVSTLFPEVQEKINLISGENKTKVRQLHRLLEKASKDGVLPYKFYSIVDWDTEIDRKYEEEGNSLTWDVYHIENYLLNSKYICMTINDLSIFNEKVNEKYVEDIMKKCAESSINSLLIHQLRKYINTHLISCINLGIDPKSNYPKNDLINATEKSLKRISNITDSILSEKEISLKEAEIKNNLLKSLSSNEWKKSFRGRDILKKFIHLAKLEIKYETFRNLIISRMRDDNYRPKGMESTLNKVLKN